MSDGQQARRRRRRVAGPAALVVVLLFVLPASSCGSSSSSGRTGSGELTVAIVSDSEIAPEVAALLDRRPGIHVVSQELHVGWTMHELDSLAVQALNAKPDVLLYSGGTNDLAEGPGQMLTGLTGRLSFYRLSTCVVAAVPIFRYRPGTDAQVARETQGTRLLERRVRATGARAVSYLDVSIAMAHDGLDFFAPGQLGRLHPDTRTYPRIAAAIATQIEACQTRHGT